jgi:hypothetical protein
MEKAEIERFKVSLGKEPKTLSEKITKAKRA